MSILKKIDFRLRRFHRRAGWWTYLFIYAAPLFEFDPWPSWRGPTVTSFLVSFLLLPLLFDWVDDLHGEYGDDVVDHSRRYHSAYDRRRR